MIKTFFDEGKAENIRMKLLWIEDDAKWNQIIMNFVTRLDKNFIYIYFGGKNLYDEQIETLKQIKNENDFTFYQIMKFSEIPEDKKDFFKNFS